MENDEAVIVGVAVPKSTIAYPLWQQDMEQSAGLILLAKKYASFLNTRARHLNIPILQDMRNLGWHFSKITGIFVADFMTGINVDDSGKIIPKNTSDNNCIFFEGIDHDGEKIIQVCPDTPWNSADSTKFQILTDWLCQNNPDFRKDYNRLMQREAISPHCFALKYTGSEPLPIVCAQYAKVDQDGSIQKTTLFDARKKENQVCPFLMMGLARKSHTK